MAYHNVRLPECIERGAQGGPEFRTVIAELVTGFEQRNILWSQTRHSWDIGYSFLRMDDSLISPSVHDLQAFFYARNGSAHSFPFQDWSDYEIGKSVPQTIHVFGAGDALTTIFQLEKRYTSGAFTYDREISKPRTGLEIYVNGLLQATPADYTIDVLTGLITFVVAPALAAPLGAIGLFDIPVRFQSDKLNVAVETFQVGSVPSINVVEVRGE